MNKTTSEDPNNNNTKKSSIFEVLRPYRAMISGLILLALASNAVNLVIPQIISMSIDDFTAGQFSLERTILYFMAAALVIFVFQILQGIVQTRASERVARDLRSKLVAKISRQSYQTIQRLNPSKLLTNFTSDMDSVKLFVSMAVVSLATSIFVVVGASVLLLTINWRLALNVLVVIPVVLFAFMFVFRKLSVFFKRSREVIDRLNKIINENIMGAALIRVLNSQIPEYNKFLDANTESKTIGMSIVRLFATLIPIVVFTGNMASLAILVLGGRFVLEGSMTLGDFAAFSSYLAILIFPILVIGFISNFIAQASVAWRRISDVLNTEDAVDAGVLEKPLKGEILIDGVSVEIDQKPVLKSVSVHVRPRTRVAIIGPTAAGKTQLLYLLTGLLLPDKGKVLFDGIPLPEFRKKSLQHQIGFVFQDSVIFNMSLRDNIAFNDAVTDELMERAIATAELGDLIASLPEGLDTMLSERGSNLSGGQQQRIMLARALALNPTILLLDDFTARVDHSTELKIQQNLIRNYPGITLVSVTQKIEPIKDFDSIVLLEEGEVLAAGTHHELMRTSPEYVQIYQSQRSTHELE